MGARNPAVILPRDRGFSHLKGCEVDGVITALKRDTRRRGKVVVHLDGRPAFTLTRSLAAELQPGQRLDEPAVERLREAERREIGYQQAMRLIAQRPRSEHEIAIRLRKHGLGEQDLRAVLGQLQDRGYLDDEAFARAWIENRMAFRPRGARALRAELRRKGVDSETIDAALEDFDELAAAEAASLKGMRKYASLDGATFRRRLMAYLSRRGFSYSMISPLVERNWREIAVQNEESEVDT